VQTVTHSLLICLLYFDQHLLKRNHVPKNDDTLSGRLGAVVRCCRQHLGISQEELAWRSNLHRTYIADIERGARNVSLKSIASLATAFQMTVGDLLSQPSMAASGEKPGAASEPTSKGHEILLVEDNAADAELALRAFERARFTNTFRVLHRAEEAWDYLLGLGRYRKAGPTRPQLILLDVHLPAMSGVEFLRRLKADERIRSIPVVMLTGSRNEQVILECGRLGAENYIVKPLAPENFIRVTPKLNLRLTLTS
jgi:two-component system response regulator